MDCVIAPGCAVGPTAPTYEFPIVSLTAARLAEVSLQPTTTTFRFPADCAPLNGTATVTIGACGVAEFTCTKAGPLCRNWSDRVVRSPVGLWLHLAPAAKKSTNTVGLRPISVG